VVANPRPLDIARRQADIVVRLVRPEPSEGQLTCRKLGDFGLAPYASRAYLATRGRPERGGATREHTAVSYQRAPEWFSAALGESRNVMFSNGPFVHMKAVTDGIGFGELPCALADANPELARVWPEDPPEVRQVWLITHRDLRRVAKIRLVANAIADEFERSRHRLRDGSQRPNRRAG